MFGRLCRGLRGLQPIAATIIQPVRHRSAIQDQFKEEKIDVGDGIRVNCLKTGHGPKTLLLIPGSLGTIWTDFRPQVEELDKSKYSLVVIELPGLGKSRPPYRDFPINFYERDVTWCVKLMQELKVSKYSVLGWSNGGISAIIMAALYPQRVEQLITCGTFSYLSEKELQALNYLRNVDNFSPKIKDMYSGYYGEEYFKQTWNRFVDVITALTRNHGGDMCKSYLSRVTCPTLVIHGSDDAMADPSHAQYLKKHIRNSRMHIIQGGSHECHISHAKEFNKLAQEFLG